MSEHVRVSLEPPVARITLDRPPVNVLTTAMMTAIAGALDRASAAEGVRVVRIDSAGRTFSAGVDVGEHMGEALVPMMSSLVVLFEALERTPHPTVAVVQGPALGGGCELALGTDLCVAAQRATFGQPEIRLGVFAPPASVLLPRLVGERRALGLLLTGETIGAAEAAAMGIVNKVVPDAELDSAAATWIDGIASMSGVALRYAKRAVLAGRGRTTREAHLEVLRLYLDGLMKAQDPWEGLQSFLDKRPPAWSHR